MKKMVWLLLVCLIIAGCVGFAGCAQAPDGNDTLPGEASVVQRGMVLSSDGIIDGVIADKYGMRGDQKEGQTPTLSIPLSIENAPTGTVCYAVSMMDPDSKPLCGYEWTHWLAVNIVTTDLPEDASICMKAEMTQCMNDFGSIGYGGPTPPDKPHTYVITVFALDCMIDLADGFSKDEFGAALSGHVLAEAQIKGSYANE